MNQSLYLFIWFNSRAIKVDWHFAFTCIL